MSVDFNHLPDLDLRSLRAWDLLICHALGAVTLTGNRLCKGHLWRNALHGFLTLHLIMQMQILWWANKKDLPLSYMKSSVVTWLIHCKNHRLELKVHDAVNHITEATRHFQILIDWLWPQRVQKPAVFLSKCVRVCLLPCLEICRDVGKKSSDTPEVDPSTGKQKVIEAKQFSICLYFGKQGKEIPRFPELDKSPEVLNLFRYRS